MKPPLFTAGCLSDGLTSAFNALDIESSCVTYGSDRLSRLLDKISPRYATRISSRTMHPFLCGKWLNRIRKGDVVWIYTNGRMVNPMSDTSIERRIKSQGGIYIFQLPDAWPLLPPMLKNACDRRVRLADLTVAVTPNLTKLLRKTYPGIRCETAEEAIDTEAIRPVETSTTSTERVILWSGPPSKKDLLQLRDVLEAVYKKSPFVLRVVSGSECPPYDFSFPWEWVPFDLKTQNDAFSGVDLAIAYYEDSPYALCKGNFKVKKYMAAGIPVVTSDLGYNRVLINSGENGILVHNNPESWMRALENLLMTPNETRRLGRVARRSVVERYSYNATATSYLNLLKKHFPNEFDGYCFPVKEKK